MKPNLKFYVQTLASAALLFGAAISPLSAQENTGADHSHDQSIEVLEQNKELNLSKDAILFSALGHDYTVEEYDKIIRYSPPRAFGNQATLDFTLYDYDVKIIKESIEQYALEQAAIEKVGLELLALPEAAITQADQEAQRMLQMAWYESKGILDTIDVSDEEILELYEEQKDEKFRIQETLSLRHIFFSGYTTHTVEEGDSLESIAEELNGDPLMAEFIMTQEQPRRPRMEPITGENGEEIPAKALSPGESLLVPLPEAELGEVLERAQLALERINAGENFELVATELGENESKGKLIPITPKPGDKPLLPEFEKTFFELGDQEVSDVFKTKHGYQIIKRESYVESGYQPVEANKAQLTNEIETTKRNELYYDLLANLWKEYDQIEVNSDVLATAEDEAVANELIMTVGDVKYPASTFVRDFNSILEENKSVEERMSLLSRVPMVARTLAEWDINRSSIEDTDSYQHRKELVLGKYYLNFYFKHRIDSTPFEPTEEAIVALFNQEVEKLKSLPAAELWQITVSPPDSFNEEGADQQSIFRQFQKDFNQQISVITTSEDFSSLAQVISEDDLADTGGYVGRVSQRFENGLGATFVNERMKNTLYGPVPAENNQMKAYFIGDVAEFGTVEIDEVRDVLNAELKQNFIRELQDQIKVELLEIAQLDSKI